MTLEQAFLERITTKPENTLPRLTFAAWLDGQGDPRGELLRIHEYLRTLDVIDRPQLEVRMHELQRAGVEPLTITRINSIGMKLVQIFPGQFRMGSSPEEHNRLDDEGQVDVTLTAAFWLGKYQVTQAEYEAVMGNSPSHFNRENLHIDANRHPVECVSWGEANEFCQQLTARERATERLTADWEYKLPTEAQWEFACRAGTTTATAFGDNMSTTQANCFVKGRDTGQHDPIASQGGNGGTVAVGSYRPNAWNLHDMHGNVWEWCLDLYTGQLPGGTDPEVVGQTTLRVTRGGSDWSCRSASRGWESLDCRSLDLGFRVALVQAR